MTVASDDGGLDRADDFHGFAFVIDRARAAPLLVRQQQRISDVRASPSKAVSGWSPLLVGTS